MWIYWLVLCAVSGSASANPTITSLQQEILLPAEMWDQSLEIRYVREEPFFANSEARLVLASGRRVREGGKDVIMLNTYWFEVKPHTDKERKMALIDTLAHEVGHILYDRAVLADNLLSQFQVNLPNVFKRSCGAGFGRKIPHHACGSPLWELRLEEAFADAVRIVTCPTCSTKPDTALIMTPKLRDTVLRMIEYAVGGTPLVAQQ